MIKPADKGGAVVAWDAQTYMFEGEYQLANPNFYKQLKTNNTKNNHQKVKQVIKEAVEEELLPQEAMHLIVRQARTSCFYMLPKIHKLGNPGRPIVSACSCPTENISSFLHEIFMPIVENLRTYVKDTNHALNIFDNFRPLNESFRIFTMDISALYTSIPNNDAILAVKHFLDKRPNPYFDTDIILRLTELVLNLNTFQFNGEYYSQTGGVAMGTKMGPSFACLFVGYLEEKMFADYMGPLPELYKRYIDDVFGATSDSEHELQSFIDFVSSYHPAIKYTFTVSEKNLSFLDIECQINDGRIHTSVFYKPTDAHCYLNYNSCHPESCKNAIPKSQFIRLRRLCSDDRDFKIQCLRMTTFFLKRGYPRKAVDRAFEAAIKLDRHSVLQTKPKHKKDRVPLVLTYHPHNTAICDILLRNFKSMVLKDPVMADIFQSPPLIAFRKGKSLRQHLVRSKFNHDSNGKRADYTGTRCCNRRICNTCPYTWETEEVRGPDNNFHIRNGFTCTTENVIYAINCTRCSMVYIGETHRRLGDRFNEHLYSVDTEVDCPVGEHFRRKFHSKSDMRVTVLVETYTGEKQRQFLEQRIINYLGTLRPRGMNAKSSFMNEVLYITAIFLH